MSLKLETIISAPYKCRPLIELSKLAQSEWTVDEKSAFAKFKGADLINFITEWENICSLLNPNRNI